MTTKRIMWRKPNGHLLVSTPTEPILEGESEGQYLDRVALRAQNADPNLSDCVRLADVEQEELPARRWRNAWRASAGLIVPNLIVARLIRRAELLLHRAKFLAKLALLIDYAVANGNNALAAALRTKRNNAILKNTAALDTDLAGVADLQTLDTFTPAALVDDQPEPD